MLGCCSLGTGTMSASSCSPSTGEWAHCINQQAVFPGGCLHDLLGHGTGFLADQTQKIKAASHSALIIHCLGADKRGISQTWSLSWGVGALHQLIGMRYVTAVPVCDQVIGWKANRALFLSFSLRCTFRNFHWLKGSGSETLAQLLFSWGRDFGTFRVSISPFQRQVSHAGRISLSSEVLISRNLLEREPGQPFRLCIYTPR